MMLGTSDTWSPGSAGSGLSSLGVPGVPWHTQILAGQLTLFKPGGTNYAHLITTGKPGFSDLTTALWVEIKIYGACCLVQKTVSTSSAKQETGDKNLLS